jgi:7-cyano-7-deazaguanine synthase
MTTDEGWRKGPVAVMVSGPDSAVLLGELARTSPRVAPLYVRFGLVWEREEEASIRRFVSLLGASAVEDVRVFDLPVRAVYGDHWSTTGVAVPDAASPDRAVELPGRNLLVLAQAAVWCHLSGVPTIALGLLRGNPFPDSSPAFFAALEEAIRLGTGSGVRVVRPYQNLSKAEVLRRGRGLPLQATWSCMRPLDGRHCGACNKCAERQRAFAEAGLPDPTEYATR